MKIIDTSALNFVMKNNIIIDDNFFVTPDILEEIFTLEIALSKSAPLAYLINIFEDETFHKTLYLNNYHFVLNSVGGKSIYTMRGMGDVSLLALAKTLVENKSSLPSIELPFAEYKEKHTIYSGDDGLRKRLLKLVGTEIEILPPESLSPETISP